MLIVAQTKLDIDISSETTICTYTHTSQDTSGIARIDIGDINTPLAGGTYTAKFYVNDILIVPRSDITVDNNLAILQSRQVVLKTGDVLRITLIGDVADTHVNVTTHIVLTMTEDEISTIAEEKMTELVRSLNISVKPERVILSPIQPCVTNYSLPIKRGISNFKLPKAN